MMSQHLHIEAPTIDDQAEADARRWAHERAVASRLDVGELISEVCREVEGDSAGDSPLVHLMAGWREAPEWDWSRPQVTPQLCEWLGRYVAGIAADVVARAIERALLGED